MKRNLAVLLGVVLICAAVSTALAQEGKEGMMSGGMKGKMMKGGGMMGRGGMMQMCPMHKMMESMAVPTLVATKDGGVVVMLGGKLYKYDRNLNLKHEVELKIGMADMQKMMIPMEKKCPMMKMMMGEGGMMGQKAEGQPAAEPVPEESSEHETHH